MGRLLRLHNDRPKAVIEYLCDGGGTDHWLKELGPDYESWALSRYAEEIYAPWRQEDAPRTWRTEAGLWRVIGEKIGELPLAKVTPFAVADLLDELVVTRGKRAGEPASGNYKRLVRAAVQACLMYAYRRQHIQTRPELGVFRIKGVTKPTLEKADPLDIDELRRLLEASSPMHRAMWAVGVGLGLRPAELVNVHWEDIDWGERLIEVRGTKTEAARDTVPLTPIAHSYLRQWWEENERPAEGLVFEGQRGPYGPQGYRKALTRCARAAGIERHLTPNLLRHSFATIAWSLGLERDVARRVLRHTSDDMLRRVYARPRPSELVSRVEAFSLHTDDALREASHGGR